MWAPLPPEPEPPGWWHDLETAEQFETRRWVEGIASDLRAERIERLHRRCHALNMKLAGVLSADRWEKIQRRRDQRDVRSHGGYQIDSWGAGPEITHHGAGRVLGVR